MREVILAKKAGFCFGVKRAVDTVYSLIDGISDLLGDNYEIYKLEDNANEIFRKGDKNE